MAGKHPNKRSPAPQRKSTAPAAADEAAARGDDGAPGALEAVVKSLPSDAPSLRKAFGPGYPQRVGSWMTKELGGAVLVLVPAGNLIYDLLKGANDVDVVPVLIWCVVMAFVPPGLMGIQRDVFRGNAYRFSAALAGIILGLMVVYAPPLAFSAAGIATLLALYGGKQIGHYAAHEELQKAVGKRTAALNHAAAQDKPSEKADEQAKTEGEQRHGSRKGRAR